MRLEIELEKNKISLDLIDSGKIIDHFSFVEKNNLSKNLLSNIDSLLKRNQLDRKQLKKINFSSQIPDFHTSSRIIKSLEKTYNFALKQK